MLSLLDTTLIFQSGSCYTYESHIKKENEFLNKSLGWDTKWQDCH